MLLRESFCNNEFKKTRSSIEVPKAFCCGRFNKFICTFVCVVVAGSDVDAAVVVVVDVVVGALVVVDAIVVVVVVVVVGAIVVVVVVVVGTIVVVLVVVVGAIVVVVVGANVVVVVLLVVEVGIVDVIGVVTGGGGIVPILPLGTPITLENGVKTSTYGLIGRGKAGLFDSIVSSNVFDATDAVITGEEVVIPKI